MEYIRSADRLVMAHSVITGIPTRPVARCPLFFSGNIVVQAFSNLGFQLFGNNTGDQRKRQFRLVLRQHRCRHRPCKKYCESVFAEFLSSLCTGSLIVKTQYRGDFFHGIQADSNITIVISDIDQHLYHLSRQVKPSPQGTRPGNLFPARVSAILPVNIYLHIQPLLHHWIIVFSVFPGPGSFYRYSRML